MLGSILVCICFFLGGYFYVRNNKIVKYFNSMSYQIGDSFKKVFCLMSKEKQDLWLSLIDTKQTAISMNEELTFLETNHNKYMNLMTKYVNVLEKTSKLYFRMLFSFKPVDIKNYLTIEDINLLKYDCYTRIIYNKLEV